MDQLTFALVLVVSVGIGLAIRMLASGRPILGDVLRDRGPDWPHGVQEDDDARWGWRPPLPDPSLPRPEPVRGHVHAGRDAR